MATTIKQVLTKYERIASRNPQEEAMVNVLHDFLRGSRVGKL